MRKGIDMQGLLSKIEAMKISRFGQKIKQRSGISQLMVDMGEGL
jgi:hypothetical protein